MSICAPKPFGSKFLKGGHSYWPLWWYGQRSKLHDMSGHGVDLIPSGAYFDGQGYYFDGVDDCLTDAGSRKIISEPTTGTWSSVYLTESEVPIEGTVRGTGTEFWLATNRNIWLTGKIVLRPESCPNLEVFKSYWNHFSSFEARGFKTLEDIHCGSSYSISHLDVGGSTSITKLICKQNLLTSLDVSTLTSLSFLWCYTNSLDQAAVDRVLCDVASHDIENGELKIYDNTAPSATGIACKDNLVARGWTVVTD